MVDAMKSQCGNVDDILRRVLPCGVGYHHSGMFTITYIEPMLEVD
jgi:hypothetical protein